MTQINMNTGDLLIFHGTSWYSYLIEWFGGSRISHVGVYLHHPERIDGLLTGPLALKSPTDQYVMHSAYGRSAETGEYIFGVHIEPFEDVVAVYGKSNVWVRKIHAKRDEDFYTRLVDAHTCLHAKPYDLTLVDWLQAEIRLKYSDHFRPIMDRWVHRTDRFWCSAMVTYLFVRLNWVFPNVDWTFVTPYELTEAGTTLRWNVPVETSQSI